MPSPYFVVKRDNPNGHVVKFFVKRFELSPQTGGSFFNESLAHWKSRFGINQSVQPCEVKLSVCVTDEIPELGVFCRSL